MFCNALLSLYMYRDPTGINSLLLLLLLSVVMINDMLKNIVEEHLESPSELTA